MNLKSFTLPKPYQIPVILLLISIACIAAHLYQMEIITIWLRDGKFTFEFPFYVEKLFGFNNGINIWVARDFWYWIAGIGWVLGIWGSYKLGSTYVYKRYEKAILIQRELEDLRSDQ